jgi:hypothetical protein
VHGNGDGTFSAGSTIASRNQSDDLIAFQVVAADFNHDGKLGVAICDELGIEVYLGNGDRTFQAGLPLIGGSAGAQTVGDLTERDPQYSCDHRHQPQLQILLGKGDGTFQQQMSASQLLSGRA